MRRIWALPECSAHLVGVTYCRFGSKARRVLELKWWTFREAFRWAVMSEGQGQEIKLARVTGIALLSLIGSGIAGAVFVSHGIDINLSADVTATATAMLEAEQRLKAKAYLGCVGFGLDLLVSIGLYQLVRRQSPLLASWSLLMSAGSALLVFLGSVFAMNAAMLAGNSAFQTLASSDERLLLTAIQATSDYTSFHLSLVLSSAAKAGFFFLLLKSGKVPSLLAGWGVFASLLVATTMVARDFAPALGHNAVTATFMLCNLIAIVGLGLFLTVRGIRLENPTSPVGAIS